MDTNAGNVEMISRIFTAVIHQEEDLYVAECPETGTVSQGSTIEEAVSNLKEATELYLEECRHPLVPARRLSEMLKIIRGWKPSPGKLQRLVGYGGETGEKLVEKRLYCVSYPP